MDKAHFSDKISLLNERWDIALPGNYEETLNFCISHFIEIANRAIQERGRCTVALSGGSTPKAIFKGLCEEENRSKVDWSRLVLFWSDERCVPPDDASSNYRMAMDAGFASLPIPLENIHRMQAEEEVESSALHYDNLLNEKLSGEPLDLVMLGMGEDGHTASLFPKTHALNSSDSRLAVANYIPKMDVWRMTMTYSCINNARNIVIYVLGHSKADVLYNVINTPSNLDLYPIQRIGTAAHKALWIVDAEAAAKIGASLAS